MSRAGGPGTETWVMVSEVSAESRQGPGGAGDGEPEGQGGAGVGPRGTGCRPGSLSWTGH